MSRTKLDLDPEEIQDLQEEIDEKYERTNGLENYYVRNAVNGRDSAFTSSESETGALPGVPLTLQKYQETEKYRGYNRSCVNSTIEVIVHSSSHLTQKHNVWNMLHKRLTPPMFELKIEAWGGRRWDEDLCYSYVDAQKSWRRNGKLHIIILGDNDVRNTRACDEVSEWVTKMGIIVPEKSGKDDEIFVNGILPFPILGRPNSDQLITNFHRITRAMGSMVHADPSIRYVPMRDPALDFCRDNMVDLRAMFKKDKVHLSPIGEIFLTNHIVHQAYMFAASKGHCVRGDDLGFGNNVASLGDGVARVSIKVLSDLRLEEERPERRPLWRYQRQTHYINRYDAGGIPHNKW